MQEETSVLRTGAVSGMDATRVTSASPTYESALSTEKCPSPTRSECGVRAGASQATMSILLPTASHVHSVARRDASGRPVTLIHSRDLKIRLSCSQRTSVSTSGPSGSQHSCDNAGMEYGRFHGQSSACHAGPGSPKKRQRNTSRGLDSS